MARIPISRFSRLGTIWIEHVHGADTRGGAIVRAGQGGPRSTGSSPGSGKSSAWRSTPAPTDGAAAFTQNGPRFASELAQMFEIRGSVARTGGMELLIAAGRVPENASAHKRVPVNQTIVPFWKRNGVRFAGPAFRASLSESGVPQGGPQA